LNQRVVAGEATDDDDDDVQELHRLMNILRAKFRAGTVPFCGRSPN
jgi:hypothetical protein